MQIDIDEDMSICQVIMISFICNSIFFPEVLLVLMLLPMGYAVFIML